jgi:hypothetical protein
MSDPEKKKSKHEDEWNDAAELGYVDHVNDLAPDPDRGQGPARRAHEQKRILNPSAAGYFEIEGGNAGGLGAPLHIGAEIKKDGGPAIGQYEAAYNSYSIPLRSTLRSMGRLRDVSLTGAPMTPAEMMRNPKLAARFKNLSLAGQSDANATQMFQERAYQDWAQSQTKTSIDVQRFGSSQHELASVLTDYRRVQKLIAQRKAEAKQAGKHGELDEINEAAETLARIVEVSVEAWSTAGLIEEEMASQVAGFNANAEGLGSTDDLPLNKDVDWEKGTGEDPLGRTSPRSLPKGKGQKAGDLADTVAQGSKMGGTIGKEVNEKIRKIVKEKAGNSTTFSISMKDMFVLAMGKGDEYVRLQRDIIALDAKIKKLKIDQEVDTIHSAGERMKGMKLEFSAIRNEVRADRKAARADAKVFGRTLGAGNEGVMAMYAAEAYQELAAFGALADQQRKDMVDPTWGQVAGYLQRVDEKRFIAIGAESDAIALNENVHAVREQRAFFAKHLPEWQQRAHQWSAFLGGKTGTPLVAEDNEADVKSQAP